MKQSTDRHGHDHSVAGQRVGYRSARDGQQVVDTGIAVYRLSKNGRSFWRVRPDQQDASDLFIPADDIVRA